jgi:hypothetical protein
MEFGVRLFDEWHPCFSWRSGSSKVETFATLAGRQVVLFFVIVVQLLFSIAELFEFGDRGVENLIKNTVCTKNINLIFMSISIP